MKKGRGHRLLRKRKTLACIALLIVFPITSGWLMWRNFVRSWLLEEIIDVSLQNMAGEGSYKISHGLIVYKTSATTYTLNDSEGFGLVNGKLSGIFYDNQEHLILVRYFPLDDIEKDFESPDMIYANESSHVYGHVDSSGNLLIRNELSYAYGRIDSSGNLLGGKMTIIEKNDSHELVVDGKTYHVDILQPIDTWYRKHK